MTVMMEEVKVIPEKAESKKLNWCLQQPRGITCIEPNKNLSKSYFNEPNKTLDALQQTEGKWSIIMGYYACYHALYAILMHLGIKNEIHDYTLGVMEEVLECTKEEKEFMKGLKSDRIDAQYYLKAKNLDDKDAVKQFVLTCKAKVDEIDREQGLKKIKEIQGDKN